jgi:hypothetical protein
MVAAHGLIDAPAPAPATDDGDHEGDDRDGGAPPPGITAWYDRLEYWIGIAIVASCAVFVLIQLEPGKLLLDTTAAGGDTGAHVWFPAFLRDHLLPWRLSGWSNDFYAGFPAGQFYFPFPALLVVALDLVLPYNVAFKLVTALGPIALPVGAYVFARGLRLPRPAAPLLAVGATAFMFFKEGGDSTKTFDLHIMGGTLASTFAGEYSFMIALACALFFLGTFARALDRRGALWLPAVFLAATFTSHLVVALFAILAATVIWLVHHPWKNLGRALAIGAVGVLLTAVWLLPLATTLGYTTDMRYEPIGDYLNWMFLGENWFLYPLALIALGAGVYYRRRGTLQVAGITFVTGLVFYEWEGIRAILGKAPAWNLRLLPFWYLMLFLLAALGVAELARLTAAAATWVIHGPEPAEPAELDELEQRGDDLPRGRPSFDATRVIAIALLAILAATVSLVRVYQTRDFLPYWARYNYTGYQGGKPEDFTQKSWPEYRAFMDTANSLAPGRMAWEGGDAIGAYGTTDSLMLLPYWTHGRIASMEGLYYESSATTPYHFLMIATLAQGPSDPVRALPYKTIADFDLGVRYLQVMGVRYYAAFSDAAKAAAAKNPALSVVATVPDLDNKPPSGWTFYEVADAPTVQGLAYQPVVVDDLHADPSWTCEGAPKPVGATASDSELSAWECTAVPWFGDPVALDRPLTDGGPSGWTRAPAATARAVPKKAVPPVTVTHIHTTESSISFDVDRTGVPVMVKTSYFPNWEAEGADGPWRATPNFMVVVPTAKHVTLTYGTTSAEWAGRVLTLVGLVGLAGLVWWGLAARGSDSLRAGTRREPSRRRVRFPSRSPR